MLRMKMTNLLGSIAIIAFGGAVVNAETLAVRLDFSPWGIHAGMHLAEAKGWFDEVGLDIDLQDGKGTINTIQLVGSGQVDVGQVQLGLIAPARENGLLLKSFAGWVRRGDLAVLVDAKSDIGSVADLDGKELVTFAASPWVPYIDNFLAAGGLTRDDVSIVMVAPPAMVGTYASGEVDGFMTVGPFGLPLTAKSRPAKQILMDDAGVTFPSYGLIAQESTLEDRRDALARLAQVQQRAWEYIFDGNVEEAADAIISGRPDSNLDREVLIGQIETYREFFHTERTKDLPIGVQSAEDWADALAAMEAAGIIKTGQQAEEFFTNALLRQ
ncbi:MAG: ABC transporter substrate-binding protein [Aestuariivita sp.]|nr:ABC transporter substrate-binding protein [Aestuariivita sp.]MCY4203163.1 ABC transporter substrate-binding protein [Aestuariivita sp.]MCY4287755.1 ABC transporter substrate-binding protein [Aestuariivita sp.]MCY4345714.1 ABC transporter substrate-binding protein [Aestuariivita sp.]